MSHSFTFEPAEVLGVAPRASLQEIRDAYREKSKRHHPDVGGDAWAFRLVAQAYQALCTARVVERVAAEAQPAAPVRPEPPRAAPVWDRPEASGQARHGPQDRVDDPARLVDVELFVIRYAIDDPTELLLSDPADRNLSASLNVTWPPRRLGPDDPLPADPERIVAELVRLFPSFARKARAQAHHVREGAARFAGWASFPTVQRATAAADQLRDRLHAAGLGVDRWSREMILPREAC